MSIPAMSARMVTTFALAFTLIPIAVGAEEHGSMPNTVEQISTHMGEMTVPLDGSVEVSNSVIFEPIQSFEDMFLRDDVVFLMRHGPTDWSKLDKYDVAPDDCDNQRIMSEEGRADMRDLGTLMARNEILPSRIVVSQWCRNQQTVSELLEGVARLDPEAAEEIPVETDGDLNLLLSLQGAPDVSNLEQIISDWDGDPEREGPLLIISHYTNIEELTLFRLFEGEFIIIDPKRDNRVLGYVRLRSAGPDQGHFAEELASPLISDEQALDMVERYYAALNASDDELLSDVISDRWAVQGLSAGEAEQARDEFLSNLSEFRDALDNPTFAIEDLYVVDGVVTVIGQIEGRHTGTLLGVPATGRDVSFGAIAVHRTEDGQIVETWQMADRFSLEQQISE